MGNLVRALTAGAVGAVVLAGIATPARAEVWDCVAGLSTEGNVAYTQCWGGFGSYRVIAKCNSGHWPYTRDVVGPWVTKVSGTAGPVSRVSGDPQGCHVVDSRTDVP
ncbi:hypothetical protein SAMN05421811_12226 [Nonomuraea wenchangensis]|uniref:Secreted protein n=1 Tax=Nonomuraea wenchangensis TaxID=568860 RepID=A0A1I0LQ02_9ACTN|nr:hypothetical protein SAMN05421811_12226 [Nonomuraea wenchangensis]